VAGACAQVWQYVDERTVSSETVWHADAHSGSRTMLALRYRLTVQVVCADKPGILASELHADGRHAKILNTPGHVDRGNVTGDPTLKMDGPAVFKLAVRVLEESARSTLKGQGFQVSDLDAYIAHQANVRIISFVGRKLGLAEDKCIVTVDRHANTSAASIPLALDVAVRDGRVKPGHLVLLQGVGGGFTWGSVLLRY